MQNTIWKLTAVAGVLGIGTLVVLQAQRGLTRSGDSTEQTSEFDEDFANGDLSTEAPDFAEDDPWAVSDDPPQFAESPPTQAEPQSAQPTLADPNDDPFAAQHSQDSFAQEPGQAAPVFGLDAPDEPTTLADSSSAPAEFGADDSFAESAPTLQPQRQLAQPDIVTASHEDETPVFGDDLHDQQPDAGGPQMLAPNPLEDPIDESQTDPFGGEQLPRLETVPQRQTAQASDWPGDSEPDPASAFDDNASPFGAEQATAQPDTPQLEPVDSLLGGQVETGEGLTEPEPLPEPEYVPEPDPAFGLAEDSANDEEESLPLQPILQVGNDSAPAELARPDEAEPLDPGLPAFDEEQPIQETGGELPAFPETDEPSLQPQEQSPETLSQQPDAEPIDSPEASEQDYLTGEATIHQRAPRGSQRPQLQIEKRAPNNAVLGQPLVYEIVVRNHGQAAAHQVVVQDRIPAGSRLSGTIPRAELLDKKLNWKLGTIEPGQEQIIKVRVVPTKEGEIGSIATVNFVAEVAAQTMITAPKIDFELLGPPQARLGEPVVFSFRVANNGSGNASGVVIRNLLPPELKHSGGNDLEYEVGDLPAGKSLDVKLTLTAARLGNAVNRAILSAAGGLSTESTAPIEIVGSKLKITRTGPKKRFLGRPAEFVNTVVNESEVPARTITVVEKVPPGLDFVASTGGGRFDPVQRAVVWRIDGIGPHDSQVLKVKLVARQEGTQQSLVTLVDSTGSREEVTSETTIVGFTNVGLQLSPIDSPVEVGTQVALKVKARNSGTNPANNVQLSLVLPNGLEPVTVEGPAPYTQEGRTLQFESIPSIDGGSDAAIEVVLIATDPGNGRLHFELNADEMQDPLIREEPIYVTE